jgi:hypothetical protein
MATSMSGVQMPATRAILGRQRKALHGYKAVMTILRTVRGGCWSLCLLSRGSRHLQVQHLRFPVGQNVIGRRRRMGLCRLGLCTANQVRAKAELTARQAREALHHARPLLPDHAPPAMAPAKWVKRWRASEDVLAVRWARLGQGADQSIGHGWSL